LRRPGSAALLRFDHENPDTTPVTLNTNNTLDIGIEVIGGHKYVLDGARYWSFWVQDEHGSTT
jgi:hypothetical protein